MQRLMPAAFLLLLLPLLPGPALSADPPSAPSPEAVFRFFDANGDGKLSQGEFLKLAERNARLKGNADLAKRVFAGLDANGDGFLSLEEFSQLGKAPGGKPPGPPAAAEPA